VVHQNEMIDIKDAEAHVVKKDVIAMAVSEQTAVSDLVYTMRAIEHFEADTTVFVACTPDLGAALAEAFPEVRFSFHPGLTDESAANMALRILRKAFESGAKAAWYMSSDLVLLAPLPAMQANVQVGLTPFRGSPPSPETHGTYDPGLIYLSSLNTLRRWEDEVQRRGSEEGGEKALDAFKGEEGTFELPCGNNVGRHEIDLGGLSSQVKCDSGLKFTSCTLASLQIDQKQSSKIAPAVQSAMSKCGSSSVAAAESIFHAKSSSKSSGRPETTTARYLGPGGCLGKWCNTESQTDSAKVVHRWKAIPHTDPAAKVAGHVIICLVLSSMKGEVERLMASLQLFQAETTIFVSGTREVAEIMPTKYPKMRFSMHACLDKYRDDTGKWLGRSALSGKKLWFAFNSERPRLMRIALQLGASGAWYMDTDVVLVTPLPLLPGVKAGLTPHRARKDVESANGHYNSGMAYFSSILHIEQWLNAKSNGNFQGTAQKVLNKFMKNPEFVDLPCGVNVGWYQFQAGSNPESTNLFDRLNCTNGVIVFKDCPVVTLHFHFGGQSKGLVESLKLALEKCKNPLLPFIHGIHD